MSIERALVCVDCEDTGSLTLESASTFGSHAEAAAASMDCMEWLERYGEVIDQVCAEVFKGGCHTCGRGLGS